MPSSDTSVRETWEDAGMASPSSSMLSGLVRPITFSCSAWEIALKASSLHTLVQMVDNGLGLTLLPKMAIDSGITRGTWVQVRPVEGKTFSRQIGIAWRASSSRKGDFALLAEYFRDELAAPLPPQRKRTGTGKGRGKGAGI